MRYPKQHGHQKIQITIKDVQDKKEILHLKQGESKWISVEYKLSEVDTALQANNNFDTIELSYIELSVIDPVNYSKGFMDFKRYTFEKIIPVAIHGKLF